MTADYREGIKRYEVFIAYFSVAACIWYVLPLYLSTVVVQIQRHQCQGIERHMLSNLALVV